MLPGLGPRVTISPNTGGSLSNRCGSSRPPASSEASRSRRSKPPLAPGCCAATLAQPTRKSLDGIKPFDSAGLRPEQLIEDVQTLPVASSASELHAGIPHSVSAASLSSESDLALLLGATSDPSQSGSTPLVFGTFPPVAVSLPADEPDAAADAEHDLLVLTDNNASESGAATPASTATATRPGSKLKATSVEFYPPAYLAAAAAATALAAHTISSNISRSASPRAEHSAEAAAEEGVPAVVTQAAEEQQLLPHPQSSAETDTAAAPAAYEVAVVHEQPQQPPSQQHWAVEQAPLEAYMQQWQQPTAEQHWQQQQHWHHWQQQQQSGQPQMVPMPVLIPVYVQPYPYPHYVQQQHPQVMSVMLPADAAAAAAAAAGQQQAQLQQQQQHMQVCPPSPGGYSLPADTCSLMASTPGMTPAVTPTAWQQHQAPYGSTRPSSSASSVVSAYSTSRRQRQQQFGDQLSREAGTVTVSAMSCVKDAAGALAKVVTRYGNSLLLSLVKPGDAAALSTHVAAKSLAVARFYINAHMAAAGAAGIDAAAALTGVDHAAEADAAEAAAAEAAAAVDDEVVFMPYHRSSGHGRSSADAADLPLGFIVAKASTKDLPVQLPPPVGIPACMQGKVQQQQHGQQPRAAAAASSGAGSSSSAPLLKAGANTDVNKLSNAVIHNILGSGHVAMQLAGAAACHVAMRSLIRARDRLRRKFDTDIVATASFANEDTSSSIGRSTVFLRLDVMRSNLLQKVAAAGSALVQAVEAQEEQQQHAAAVAMA